MKTIFLLCIDIIKRIVCRKDSKELIMSSFKRLNQSIDTNNVKKFMSFQNPKNRLFHKEQYRWIVEVIEKRRNNYTINATIKDVSLKNNKNGIIFLNLYIKRPSGRFKNYQLIYSLSRNLMGKWFIDDYPFLTIKAGVLDIKYTEDSNPKAELAQKNGVKIVSFYKSFFNWNPEIVYLKIFNTLDQISSSIPSFTIYGWSESGEAIKILVPSYVEDKNNRFIEMLKHELTHYMLSDLTNDNAALFFQEGLAIYFEKSLILNEKNPQLNKKHLKYLINEIVTNKDFKSITIKKLSELTYDSGQLLYFQSFLLVYYLIEIHGIKKIKILITKLREYKYIDSRIEYKQNVVNQRTLKAIEETYGDLDVLSLEVINYYKNWRNSNLEVTPEKN